MRWVAVEALRAAWREPSVRVVLIVAVMAGAGGWWWRDFDFGGQEARFLLDFGLGVQGLVGAGLAIVLTAQRVNAELESGGAAAVVGRLISRGEWMVGTGIGVLGLVVGYVAAGTLVLAVVLGAGPGLGAIGGGAGLAWVAMLQVAKLAVVVSFTLWFASYGRGVVFAVMAALLFWLAGHVRFLVGEDAGVVAWIVRAVPDLQRISLDAFMEATGRGAGAGGPAVMRLIYAAMYAVAYGAAAAWSFSRRDL